MAQEETKAPLAPAIRDMEVGDELTYPIERMRSVYKSVYEANLLLDGTYKTKISKEKRTVTIIRTC